MMTCAPEMQSHDSSLVHVGLGAPPTSEWLSQHATIVDRLAFGDRQRAATVAAIQVPIHVPSANDSPNSNSDSEYVNSK